VGDCASALGQCAVGVEGAVDVGEQVSVDGAAVVMSRENCFEGSYIGQSKCLGFLITVVGIEDVPTPS
jgi:hypothetical protein